MAKSPSLNLHKKDNDALNSEPDTAPAPASDALIDDGQSTQMDEPDKIEQDIAFLEDRIERLRALPHVSKTTLQTYEDMLQRRYHLLERLQRA